MSNRIFGRIISDQLDSSGRNAPLEGFRVSIYWGSFKLKSDESKAGGILDFEYRRDTSEQGHHRTLELVVQDNVGREVARKSIEDTSSETLSISDFVIKEVEARGFLVTLGTGETGPSGGGWGLTQGATVKFLIDNEAFQKAAQLFLGARDSIYFSQLFFPVPDVFHADATQETTNLIFDFHQRVPDADHLRAAGVGDSRPERLLLEAADRDVEVRILLHSFKVPLFVKILAGLLIFPFAGTDGISAIEELLSNEFTDTDEDKQYFALAERPGVKVRAFEQSVLSAGVMHPKLMIVDGARALSIGSPFGQSYIDSHSHFIDAPVRGAAHDFPKHDAGFIAKGPVIGTMYNALKQLWDTAAPDDKLQDYPPTPPDSHHGASTLPDDDWDAVCSIQIVRTLSARKFPDQPDGEKGILEAYLRAFNMAKEFIYLENQYFTDNAIGDALVEAMKHNDKLQTIMLLNIRPDVPFYPWKQRRLIHCIRKGLSNAPNGGAARFGVFTRWSHQVGTPRPQLLPIYIHAKVGIVDDTWCTVGSANLDGLSLDYFLLNPFVEQRAIELNAIMLNGVEGAPASEAPDILRRKLWAEHLGYRDSSGAPDINSADLKSPPQGGWLQHWINRAKGTLSQLINDPTQPLTGSAQVLPWPTDNTTHKTPRDYLETLGIHSYAVVPLKGTQAFDFKTGEWNPKYKAAMDYD
ncbi:MAG: phospholipase D family protein [Bryobacteraceae bacterium]|jgi:phosphatidylserine/phosphatidylglycerophosphate/cardiolipin synthase-like enzyme